MLKTELVEEVVIQDQKPYIGELQNIKFKSRDFFFTYDNRRNLQKFNGYEFVKHVGSKGKGPCEHGAVNNFAVNRDSLFILDGSQGKFLTYSTDGGSNGQCFEILNDQVQQLAGIEVIEQEPFFIRGSLVKSAEPTTPIIYTYQEENKEILPTNVVLEDLDIPLTGIPVNISLASDKRSAKLFFYLPLTRKVLVYNTKTKSLDEITVDIYIARDENIHELKDMQKWANLFSNKIEVVFDLFALDQAVALGYRRGTGEDQVWGLKVFNHSGEKIADKEFDNRVVYMDEEGTLMTLNLNTNRQENPYSFEIYDYTL